MRDIMTFHALNRTGLGPAPGEEVSVGDDPRGWVKAQIGARNLPRMLSRFRSSADIHAACLNKPDDLAKTAAKTYRRSLAFEILARARVIAGSTTPFAERMVAF